jgi:hypothetical protein
MGSDGAKRVNGSAKRVIDGPFRGNDRVKRVIVGPFSTCDGAKRVNDGPFSPNDGPFGCIVAYKRVNGAYGRVIDAYVSY